MKSTGELLKPSSKSRRLLRSVAAVISAFTFKCSCNTAQLLLCKHQHQSSLLTRNYFIVLHLMSEKSLLLYWL